MPFRLNSSNSETAAKIYLISFPAQPNDLNFKLNIGHSATINQERAATIVYKTSGVCTQAASGAFSEWAIHKTPQANRVQAGVGKPMKKSV